MESGNSECLDQCMGRIAYVLDRLGITEAQFSNGILHFKHDGGPVDGDLIKNLCQHILSIQKDELTTGDEDFAESYFH